LQRVVGGLKSLPLPLLLVLLPVSHEMQAGTQWNCSLLLADQWVAAADYGPAGTVMQLFLTFKLYCGTSAPCWARPVASGVGKFR